MIRSIVEWSTQFRLVVVVLGAILVLFAAGQIDDARVDIYPEFEPVTVEVRSEALGLSAQEVSEVVTAPLEADLLSNVPWVDIVRSESVPGLSSVELIFEPGTDLMRARQVVQERVSEAAVALAGASKPPEMLQPRASTSRVMMIGLSSQDLSLIDLSVLARWNIRPRLLGVEGVSNVAIWGQREQQLQVQVDPARLNALRVPLIQVIEATANALWSSPLSFVEASVPGTGGWIDTPNQRIGVQHISPITTADDLAQVALQERPNLRISDLANVVEDHQPLIGDAILKDGPGLVLVVEKWPEANTLEVTRAIEDALEAMAPGLQGVQVDSQLYRPARYLDEAGDNLSLLALVAAALVIAVLILVLFDIRTALIGAITIPLSLFVAANIVAALGAGLDLMVLAGLVAGLVYIIDDAVLGATSLAADLRQARSDGTPTSRVISDAFVRVQAPLAFAVLIILLGLMPLFFLGGVAGKFYPAAALAYGVAVACSAVITMVLAPALAVILFPSGSSVHRASAVGRKVRDGYSRVLGRILANPVPAFAIGGIAVVVSLALITQLSQPTLLPRVEERSLLVQWEGGPGTSQPEMSRIVTAVAAEIQALPGIANVGAHVGRAITSDRVVGVNSAQLWVSIDPDAGYDATVESLQRVLNNYPGFDRNILSYPEQQVAQVFSDSPRDLVVRVYGDDLAALRTQAEAVRNQLSTIDGVVNAAIDLPAEEPTVEIQVDLAAAQRFGIKPGDVRRASATMLSGLLVGNLFEEQKVFEVVVWSTPETRSSLNSVQNLLIDTPTGAYVRLADVADVRVAPNPAVIKREAVSRYVDVVADVDGRGRGDVESDVRAGLRDLNFPIEYHAEIATDKAGGYLHSAGSAIPYVVTAGIGILLLLQAATGSWRFAVMAFAILPTGLIGGIIAVIIAGGDLSIGSYVGFVAVLGLCVRNGIGLFGHYQRLERDSGSAFDAGLALLGAADRAVPAITTALAVGLVMLTIVLAGPMAGVEIIRPAAIVILGGVVSTTVLTLLVLPALYLRFWQPNQSELSPE